MTKVILSAYTSPELETVVFLARDRTTKLVVIGNRSPICLLDDRSVFDSDFYCASFARSYAIAMKQCEQKNRRRLTGSNEDSRVPLPECRPCVFVGDRVGFPRTQSNELRAHSRRAVMSLLFERNASVSFGSIAEVSFEFWELTQQQGLASFSVCTRFADFHSI